jgi:mediator of RNA polymerase II transcription subunit 13
VIYIINTFVEPDAVVYLCAAFLRLFHTYLQVEKSSLYSGPSEIVLQLIPVSFVASKTSIIVPTQADYRGLAFEVYERCGLGLGQSVDGAVAPLNAASILLSHKIPASIDFKLSAEPPLSVGHESTDLHVAYCQSGDGRWISASWTDTEGNRQMSMSYCVRMKGSRSIRTFGEIAREIWKISIEMVQVKKMRWRFVIAKVGIMEPEERDGKLHNN